MLGGFYRPDTGAIRLGPDAIQGRPALRDRARDIARTYQTSRRLRRVLSVLDNLIIAEQRGRLGWSFAPAPDEAISARPARSQATSAIAATHRAADLPHLDRRLVEIARALATEPSVLLLDEPAAGLSRTDKDALAALLRRVADAGIAVVLVEHDMSLVMGISDRWVIDAGSRIAAGCRARCRRIRR